MGKDPKKANLQISFGVPDVVSLTVDQVLALYNSKAITVEEFREYIKNKKALDLFDDDKINNDEKEEDPQEQNFELQNKRKQMEKRAKQIKKEYEDVSEADLRKTRKKLIKKIAEKEGFELD